MPRFLGYLFGQSKSQFQIAMETAAPTPTAARLPASRSLPEVHGSVSVAAPGFWRRLFAFAGPAYMVSVGYMDPGNWATDIEGGSRFAYSLLWVLAMSNLMAVLLQTLSARLGIVTGRDLARACRESYPRPVSLALWVLCELAIAACDLAEVLGTAIGLNLLFGIHLTTGVLITGLDVFILLAIQRLGMRRMEAFILVLVATIGGCYVFELFLAKPDWTAAAGGLLPQLPSSAALYVAIGMLGATVMPHNLYLHSALVQTRQVARTPAGMREANRHNLIDSSVALNCAFFVNAAMLILAAAAFHRNGQVVTELQQAHSLLAPLLGTAAASTAFAVALLCAGQSSTLTGTLAGQVVMEGFLNLRMRPWMRRLLTRSLAIVPAVITITLFGEASSYKLLILSQVILSLQLPFAIVPLIHFTSERAKMGDFASRAWVKVLAWITAAVVITLNAKLLVDALGRWLATSPHLALSVPVLGIVGAVSLLLVYVTLKPWLGRLPPIPALRRRAALETPSGDLAAHTYHRIGVALAADDSDRPVLNHAISLARLQGAQLLLVHVAEGFGPRFFGGESTDQETVSDRRYLEAARQEVEASGIDVDTRLLFGEPVEELFKLEEHEPLDMLVMGGHGHRWFGDLLFGSTVTPLRHRARTPIFVVRNR
jgi:manganese transport protein